MDAERASKVKETSRIALFRHQRAIRAPFRSFSEYVGRSLGIELHALRKFRGISFDPATRAEKDLNCARISRS